LACTKERLGIVEGGFDSPISLRALFRIGFHAI